MIIYGFSSITQQILNWCVHYKLPYGPLNVYHFRQLGIFLNFTNDNITSTYKEQKYMLFSSIFMKMNISLRQRLGINWVTNRFRK